MKVIRLFVVFICVNIGSSYSQTVGTYIGQAYLTNITSNCANAYVCGYVGDADFTNTAVEIQAGSIFTGTWNTGASYLPNPLGPELLLVSCHTLSEVWDIRLKLSNGTWTGYQTYMMNVDTGGIPWTMISGCNATSSIYISFLHERTVATVNFESFTIPVGVGVTGAEFTVVSDGATNPDPTGILVLQDAIPLPVVFNGFNFSCDDNDIANIKWETLSELNCDYYTIQTSIDGETFEDYRTVNGVGTTNTTTKYEINLPRSNKNQYVRINQVDKNGNISSVYGPFLIDCKTNELELYPNPTTDEINLIGSKNDGESELVLIDLNSKIVKTFQHDFTNNQMVTIDLSEFTSGVYYLKIITEKKMEFRRVVKN